MNPLPFFDLPGVGSMISWYAKSVQKEEAIFVMCLHRGNIIFFEEAAWLLLLLNNSCLNGRLTQLFSGVELVRGPSLDPGVCFPRAFVRTTPLLLASCFFQLNGQCTGMD